MASKITLLTVATATRYSTWHSDFLLLLDSNSTRSQKPLLAGACSSVCHGANQPQFLHLGLVFHGVFLQLQRLSSIYNGFVKTICSFPQCSSSACSQSCWACLSKVFKTERNQVEYYTYNKVALTDTLKTQEWWLAWFFPIFFLSMPMPILFSAKCSIHHSPPFLDLSTCFH